MEELIKDYYENKNIKSKKYFVNKKCHKENGPAIIDYYENGNIKSETYYINDKLHREDGPASIEYNPKGGISYEHYFINDELHRDDGPAVIWYHENGNIKFKHYYIHGKEVDLSKYVDISYNKIINLINKCKNDSSLLEIKLLINVKVKKNKEELLDLIQSQLIMFKLM